MHASALKVSSALSLAIGLLASSLLAQAPPFNATEIGSYDEPGQQWADIWGDGQFAYLAHNGQRTVTIVDITDPTNPVFASRYDSGDTEASAQDVKVAEGLMFVGLERTSPGCHIVDVRDPYAPVKLTDVTVLSEVHNVFYDQGWLYLVDSDTTVIHIVDLRTYDPDNAPATIDTSTWVLTGVGNQIVHDITVKDGRLYASAWDSLRVYDVSDVANEEPPLLGSIQGDNAHAAWPTDDGRFVVSSEERESGGMTLYEIIEGVDAITLETRDYFIVPREEARSAHNPLIVGNRVYHSWYASGVQAIEIDPVTATFVPVASFDTTASNGGSSVFAGCWGVYPFLGEDRVLASDRQDGLKIIDFAPQVLHFHDTSSLPKTVKSTGGPLTASIQAIGSPVVDASVTASISINGATPLDVNLAAEGGRDYAGQFPTASCGDTLEVSFSAQNEAGATFLAPSDGGSFRVDVSDGPVMLFEDTFDSDFGWTVTNTNLSGGAWQRGDPLGNSQQPEFDASGDVTGQCYFTGQYVAGSAVTASDVDGGPSVLTSPTFDHSAGGGIVSYSYWISEDDGNDSLVVEISANGTTWVEARRYDGDTRRWQRDAFRIEDFVSLSAETQVRFVISDNPNNSVVEAAIDDVQVYLLACDTVLFVDGFESGDTTAWSEAF